MKILVNKLLTVNTKNSRWLAGFLCENSTSLPGWSIDCSEYGSKWDCCCPSPLPALLFDAWPFGDLSKCSVKKGTERFHTWMALGFPKACSVTSM